MPVVLHDSGSYFNNIYYKHNNMSFNHVAHPSLKASTPIFTLFLILVVFHLVSCCKQDFKWHVHLELLVQCFKLKAGEIALFIMDEKEN